MQQAAVDRMAELQTLQKKREQYKYPLQPPPALLTRKSVPAHNKYRGGSLKSAARKIQKSRKDELQKLITEQLANLDTQARARQKAANKFSNQKAQQITLDLSDIAKIPKPPPVVTDTSLVSQKINRERSTASTKSQKNFIELNKSSAGKTKPRKDPSTHSHSSQYIKKENSAKINSLTRNIFYQEESFSEADAASSLHEEEEDVARLVQEHLEWEEEQDHKKQAEKEEQEMGKLVDEKVKKKSVREKLFGIKKAKREKKEKELRSKSEKRRADSPTSPSKAKEIKRSRSLSSKIFGRKNRSPSPIDVIEAQELPALAASSPAKELSPVQKEATPVLADPTPIIQDPTEDEKPPSRLMTPISPVQSLPGRSLASAASSPKSVNVISAASSPKSIKKEPSDQLKPTNKEKTDKSIHEAEGEPTPKKDEVISSSPRGRTPTPKLTPQQLSPKAPFVVRSTSSTPRLTPKSTPRLRSPTPTKLTPQSTPRSAKQSFNNVRNLAHEPVNTITIEEETESFKREATGEASVQDVIEADEPKPTKKSAFQRLLSPKKPKKEKTDPSLIEEKNAQTFFQKLKGKAKREKSADAAKEATAPDDPLPTPIETEQATEPSKPKSALQKLTAKAKGVTSLGTKTSSSTKTDLESQSPPTTSPKADNELSLEEQSPQPVEKKKTKEGAIKRLFSPKKKKEPEEDNDEEPKEKKKSKFQQLLSGKPKKTKEEEAEEKRQNIARVEKHGKLEEISSKLFTPSASPVNSPTANSPKSTAAPPPDTFYEVTDQATPPEEKAKIIEAKKKSMKEKLFGSKKSKKEEDKPSPVVTTKKEDDLKKEDDSKSSPSVIKQDASQQEKSLDEISLHSDDETEEKKKKKSKFGRALTKMRSLSPTKKKDKKSEQ